MNPSRYCVRYADRGCGERVWHEVPVVFGDVASVVAAASSIEGSGPTTQIVDEANPNRRDLYPRRGS